MTTPAPANERYTPEERRAKLRAFADRMLERLEDLPPPEDVAELERTVRVGLLIERLYARVDVSERKAPPPERTEEEIAETRRENEFHYQKFLARWGLSSPKPEPEPQPAPSDAGVDESDGYGFDDDLDSNEITPEDVVPLAEPELDGRAAFKASFSQSTFPDSS